MGWVFELCTVDNGKIQPPIDAFIDWQGALEWLREEKQDHSYWRTVHPCVIQTTDPDLVPVAFLWQCSIAEALPRFSLSDIRHLTCALNSQSRNTQCVTMVIRMEVLVPEVAAFGSRMS